MGNLAALIHRNRALLAEAEERVNSRLCRGSRGEALTWERQPSHWQLVWSHFLGRPLQPDQVYSEPQPLP